MFVTASFADPDQADPIVVTMAALPADCVRVTLESSQPPFPGKGDGYLAAWTDSRWG